MQGYQAHSPGCVSCIAVYCHVRCDVGSVIDIGGLSVRRVCSACVVVVTAQHHRSDLSLPYHLVELQRDVPSSQGILVQDTALGAHYQFVLLRVTDPDVVIPVLAPSVRVDHFHGCMVCGTQVLRLAGQTAPAERAVSVVKQLRSQDILHIGREDESFACVHAVLGDVLCSRIEHGTHEGVSVIEEVGASLHQGLDQVVVFYQGLVHQLAESLFIVCQHLRALLKGQALRAVASVVRHMAACLVR